LGIGFVGRGKKGRNEKFLSNTTYIGGTEKIKEKNGQKVGGHAVSWTSLPHNELLTLTISKTRVLLDVSISMKENHDI